MLGDTCCAAQVSSLHARGDHDRNVGRGAWLFLLPQHTCALCATRSICSVLVTHPECTFKRNFREQDPYTHISLGP